MSSPRFSGSYTAIVTPFTADDRIDYDAVEKLLSEQVEAGITGIVVCGTTGESPTVRGEERRELLKFVIRNVKGQSLVVVATGTNSTKDTVEDSKQAAEDGADALILVNPYYNKPTQEGLYRHFLAIADSVQIPQILYNIAGRTGVNLATDTVVRLAAHKNIVGVKEASGDINQIMDVIARVPEDFAVLSGDDSMTYPLLALGGHGVISVLSNLIPAELTRMVNAGLKGDLAAARALHEQWLALMRACFIETNPIPVKTALALMGKIGERFRLPLCEMAPANRDKLKKALTDYRLLR